MAFALSPFDLPAGDSDAAGTTGGRGPVQFSGRHFVHRDTQSIERGRERAAEHDGLAVSSFHSVEVDHVR